MRWLVEDVTEKKIEHLIKRSLSGPGTSLRRNVQLVRCSQRPRDAYAAFLTGVFSENTGPTTLARIEYRRHRGYRLHRIVNSMSYAPVCTPRQKTISLIRAYPLGPRVQSVNGPPPCGSPINRIIGPYTQLTRTRLKTGNSSHAWQKHSRGNNRRNRSGEPSLKCTRGVARPRTDRTTIFHVYDPHRSHSSYLLRD